MLLFLVLGLVLSFLVSHVSHVCLQSIPSMLCPFCTSSVFRPLRTFEAGGACLVAEHMRGEMLAKMEGSEHAVQHPFYQFYQRQLAELRAAMADAERLGLPIGVMTKTSIDAPFFARFHHRHRRSAVCRVVHNTSHCSILFLPVYF